MKQIRYVVMALIVALGTFTLVISGSCKKDACKDVVCKNKGTCSNGVCSCPTGFSGKHCELSTIAYKNNSYTPVSITVNGNAYTILKDSTLLVTDTAGKNATVTASTAGKSASGATIGYTVTWSLTNTFPTDGTQYLQPLDVQPGNPVNDKEEIYYLEVVNNNDTLAATQVVLSNISKSERISIDRTFPNDKKAYGVGYFIGDGNNVLQANNFNSSTFVFTTMTADRVYMLPYTLNQKYTFVIK